MLNPQKPNPAQVGLRNSAKPLSTRQKSGRKMTHMQFRAEFEDGRSIEFVPKSVEPLGLLELWATLEDERPAYHLNFVADNPIVDGQQQNGSGSIKATINFHETPTPFALVQGGWLPLPLVIPPMFLVDRNVVAHLRRLNDGASNDKLRAFKWWMQFFSEGSATFNPLPYAWEGGLRKTPSFQEFVSSFEEGVSEIRVALPKSKVITYGPDQYRAAYQMIQDFEPRALKEVAFLCAVCPLVADRANRSSEKQLLNTIVLNAESHGIGLNSLVFVVVLSCLYDDLQGRAFSIGRRLLKPKRVYEADAAFNALADLRHIEVAAAGQVYFGDRSFSLSTCDHALASLWCALSPRGIYSEGHEIEFTFDLTKELFPRLSEGEIFDVNTLLQG